MVTQKKLHTWVITQCRKILIEVIYRTREVNCDIDNGCGSNIVENTACEVRPIVISVE